MKVLRDGKEVKNAKVIYTSFGTPDVVVADGVSYDPKAFELVEEEPQTKKKVVEKKSTNKK